MPKPKRQPNSLIQKYFRINPAGSGAGGLGEPKPVEPASRHNGVPVLGPDQAFVMKQGTTYHTDWCQAVADKWDHAPRGLLVTLLADIGARTPCTDCDRPRKTRGVPSARADRLPPPLLAEALPPDATIPLRVIGVAHGILFLAAGVEYQEVLRNTAVEPATMLFVDGRRDGMVVRLDAVHGEPRLTVQLDPRATFRDGPYHLRLRRPLLRSATKAYAVDSVEPAFRSNSA
ncbi:hypothetical protein F8G81_14320 [Arthrobacter sp. CDRTa11]|uniref:hypothetical protein n=1 Tax=Arthrobacter sp. CDRTa11 TaxID=2651199 RepID=UPI0022659A71|nr:hypothetical protein [Arthrobacter sp. CDRTa11]UZX03652.1 hypothetical protein F8G81_14320 [Arthrobacter sp. CDRTa11]